MAFSHEGYTTLSLTQISRYFCCSKKVFQKITETVENVCGNTLTKESNYLFITAFCVILLIVYLNIDLKLNEWQGRITGQPTRLSLRCESS